jgi:sulfur carrier protein
MITIEVNGKPFKCEANFTVREYLDSLDLQVPHIAVAHNGMVLARARFSEVRLADGDKLEIVRPVGGG